MKLVRLENIATFITPKGITAKKILENKSFVIMNILLKSGEVLEKHEASVDIFFYVMKGKGIIQIGNEEEYIGATDIVFSPKGTPHGLKTLPGEELQVLVVKNPISG
ncbi:cupin domain-containing protein [Pelotomaculum isophthalicicum JI]|uniref:Cupin domain-containing protein n=1 Tax=Pelotomaculum isophthalicicum JI TaxID=947010 RepID=A0A9X4JVH0_9FIRM|nr:cupin domain-containing protein [Pelotomaculum isophthalicicum]MDF9407377.1 cupin domain-containing protein [Pelotomaculum isophthalicicum JI]